MNLITLAESALAEAQTMVEGLESNLEALLDLRDTAKELPHEPGRT